MKSLLTALFIMLYVLGHGQSCAFSGFLEEDASLIECGENYTIEKSKKGSYIVKEYHPDRMILTNYTTYKSRDSGVKHGLYYSYWSDGTLVHKGYYANNMKVGKWINSINQVGFYKDDMKIGEWFTYENDSIKVLRQYYQNGQLHGKTIKYDHRGEILYERIYQFGKLIETTEVPSTYLYGQEAIFGGCEQKHTDLEKMKKCSENELVMFLYRNLHYPDKVKESGIEGVAIVEIAITEEGEVGEIWIRNGICKEIEKEIQHVIKKMPPCQPVVKDGVAVESIYRLPIRFRIN